MAPCSWSPVPTSFGVQVSVCGLEFSAFYGPTCPACAAADVSGKTCGGLPEWFGGGTATALASTGAGYHPWRPPPLAETASSPTYFFNDRGAYIPSSVHVYVASSTESACIGSLKPAV